MHMNNISQNSYNSIIRIDKPTYNRIVIPTLEIIHSDLVIVVVSAVTIRIYRCDRALGSIAYNSADTPRIVGILRNSLYILIDNRNDIALQILYKVVRFTVVDDSADAVLIIVKRDDCVAAPYLFQNLRSVEHVGMLDTIYGLRGTNSVRIVGVSVSIKGFKLSALFPCQRMTEV